MKTLMVVGLLLLQGAPALIQNGPSGTITGQVMLAGNLPAAGTRIAVLAVPATASGSAPIASLAEVDKDGNFRFEDLSPGPYYIRAGLADAPIKDSPTYYPGVEAVAQARAISVIPNSSISGINFALAKVAGVKVTGRVTGLPSSLPPGMVRVTLARGSPPMGTMGLSAEVPVSADGSFEFRNVVPGSYFFRTSPSTIPPTTTPIDVANRDLDSINLPIGQALLGHVVVEGGTLPVPAYSLPQGTPNTLSSLTVMANNQQTAVRSDGSFLWILAAGEYKVDMTNLPFGYHIKAMSFGSVDLLQTTLKIAGSPLVSSDEVRITLTAPAASKPAGVKVSGRFTGLPGDANAVRQVRMDTTWTRETVPPWRDRHREDTILRDDGSFEFLHVPPGVYYLTGLSNGSTTATAAIVVFDVDVANVEVSNSSPVVGLPAELQTQLEFRRTIFSAPAVTPPTFSQSPVPMPKRFEIYYETGVRGSVGLDAFDSEKKDRLFDARGGEVRYRAQLTADDASKVYQAIQQNNIIAGRKDFTDMGNIVVEPAGFGRLRVDIDGQITEFRFMKSYGTAHRDDAEWSRFRNVSTVIESILKEKDQQQTLPPHNMYF